MEKIFQIYGAFSWKDKCFNECKKVNDKDKKNSDTPKAFQILISQIEKRIKSNLKSDDIKLRYNRLRATAGSFVLDGIVERIKKADAIIFDITNFNPNVMFELGIAMEATRNIKGAKVFIICKGKTFNELKIPGDLYGYFISLYENTPKGIEFHDNNSLAMRLISEIADKFEKAYIEDL